MKYCIFGLPGSGKGLYSKYIEKITEAPQLSTGDLLRQIKQHDQTSIGDEVRALGPTDFASDDLIIRAIKEELKKEKYSKGVIFDGFPRTLAQAKKMVEMGLTPDAVISIDCSEKSILDRIEGRRVHLASGRVYHTKNAPPKVEGIDDITGEPLTIRDDDRPEYMEKRFSDFNEKTLPAVEFLKSKCLNGSGPVFTKISGEISPEEAYRELDVTIGSISAIHKIRKSHIFTLVTMPYDVKNKDEEDKLLREGLHQTLMKGEVPFSAEIFYYQKNMLDPNNEKHREIVQKISEEILKKSDKLLIISKDENDPEKSLLESNGVFLNKENVLLYALAKKENKQIELIHASSLNPFVKKYQDDSVLVHFDLNNFNNGDVLKLLNQNKDNLTEVLSKENQFVIIESPYAGDKNEILKNENYARAAALSCLEKGEIPFASHILYTQKGILEDTKPAQRRLGIEAGLLFGNICDKSVMYSDLGMSNGMIEGIDKAKKLGRQVEIRTIESFQTLYENAINRKNNKPKNRI